MTRPNDAPLPLDVVHPIDPGSPIYPWPYRPVIALEMLPQSAYVWDDTDDAVVWDAPGDVYVWDAPQSDPGFTDAVCDFMAIEIEPGEPDELYLFPPAELTVTLDNRDGRYTPWTADGRLTYWAPGRRVAVWADDGSGPVVADGAYLRPAISHARTPAGLPVTTDGFNAIVRVRGPVGSGLHAILAQWPAGATGRSWTLERQGSTGRFGIGISASGTAMDWIAMMDAGGPPSGDVELFAIVANLGAGTGQVYRSDDDGNTWTPAGAPASWTPVLPAASFDPITVGDDGVAGQVWDDRIYDVAVRTGSVIGAGAPIVIFHAGDYPGGDVLGWTDPRGRGWTIGAAGAVVPAVLAGPNPNSWWLFAGRVASWQANADATVTVTAYDDLSLWAQPLGGDWTPGVAGQLPAQRITSIATAAAYPDPMRLDAGDVNLSTEAADDAPLEAAQRVALSDGGLFYADADGRLVYRDRLWRAGRDDTPTAWVIASNVCGAPVVVWAPEAAADDDRLATDVRLVNLGGLVATASSPNPSPWAGTARYRLTHPDPDLWTTQAQGDTLAAYLLAQQGTPSMALKSFELYPLDPRQQPAVAELTVGLRRGDRVNVLHEFTAPDGRPGQLDLFAVVLGIGHAITPEGWTARVELSRTVDWRAVETWDVTRFVWDDTDPDAVWRY